MHRIMLVDDELNILSALRRALVEESYETDLFTDVHEALNRAECVPYDLVLTDFRMPAMDGIAFLNAFKEVQPETIRLIMSAYADLELMFRAINEAEVYRFIGKPWHDFGLREAISRALEHHDLIAEHQRLADKVRDKQRQIDRQKMFLKRLEADNPGITKVNWADDGSIMIDGAGI